MKYHTPAVSWDPQDDPDCEAEEFEQGLHDDDQHEAQVERYNDYLRYNDYPYNRCTKELS